MTDTARGLQTRIELEQGNYPKPPAWLTAGGAAAVPSYSLGSFAPSGMNSYAGTIGYFNMEAFGMGEVQSSTMPPPLFSSLPVPVGMGTLMPMNTGQGAFGGGGNAVGGVGGGLNLPAGEGWMQEQDNLLQQMVASAMNARRV